jgi:hypothetical protein
MRWSKFLKRSDKILSITTHFVKELKLNGKTVKFISVDNAFENIMAKKRGNENRSEIHFSKNITVQLPSWKKFCDTLGLSSRNA